MLVTLPPPPTYTNNHGKWNGYKSQSKLIFILHDQDLCEKMNTELFVFSCTCDLINYMAVKSIKLTSMYTVLRWLLSYPTFIIHYFYLDMNVSCDPLETNKQTKSFIPSSRSTGCNLLNKKVLNAVQCVWTTVDCCLQFSCFQSLQPFLSSMGHSMFAKISVIWSLHIFNCLYKIWFS